MKTTLATIRGTFFTNKPVEIDYDKSLRIVSELQSHRLFSFPVNGFSFQIGPGGMIPSTLNSFEFRNSDNSLNISIGPDRIDVNTCKNFNSIDTPFEEMVGLVNQVICAFQSCIEFKIIRLALASSWILATDNLGVYGAKLFHDIIDQNLIEWEIRRVERSDLESIGVSVNYGHKIARGLIKFPTEQVLTDRIFIETDINTVPLPPDVLDKDKTFLFFNNAIVESSKIVSKYIEI